MARDWRMKIASFNGATFYVDTAAPAGGRRKVIHEYPGSEYWDVEDLGTKAKRVSVTAYFCSDTADTDYAALVAACDQPDPGELSLPFFGIVEASAETWDPQWSQERLNYVGGQFAFIVENPADAPVPIGLGERIIASLVAGASVTFGAAISTLYAGMPATSWQRADAVPHLADLGAFVETVRQSTVLPAKTSARVALGLEALAPALAAETDPGAYVAQALALLDALAIDADPDAAAASFRTAAALAVAMLPSTIADQPDADQAADTIAVATASAASLQAMRLTATATYTDRPAAQAARDTIRGLAEAMLPVLGALGADAAANFTDLWGQAATHLSRVILDLAPVVLFQTNASLPSTALAYRLYGDPARAAELVARNRVSTPAMMPTIFEAASA